MYATWLCLGYDANATAPTSLTRNEWLGAQDAGRGDAPIDPGRTHAHNYTQLPNLLRIIRLREKCCIRVHPLPLQQDETS